MIYLIDYENVGGNGLTGIDNLTEEDNVYVFYSSKVEQFPIDLVPLIMSSKANFKYEKALKCVPQNVDFRIGTFTGYLVGHEKDVTIISNDKGYNNVKEFWEEKGIKRIRICKDIAEGIGTVSASPAEEVTTTASEEKVTEPVNYKTVIKEKLDREGVPKRNGKTNVTVYTAFEKCKKLGDYHFTLVNDLGRELGQRCYELTEDLFKAHRGIKK